MQVARLSCSWQDLITDPGEEGDESWQWLTRRNKEEEIVVVGEAMSMMMTEMEREVGEVVGKIRFWIRAKKVMGVGGG